LSFASPRLASPRVAPRNPFAVRTLRRVAPSRLSSRSWRPSHHKIQKRRDRNHSRPAAHSTQPVSQALTARSPCPKLSPRTRPRPLVLLTSSPLPTVPPSHLAQFFLAVTGVVGGWQKERGRAKNMIGRCDGEQKIYEGVISLLVHACDRVRLRGKGVR